VGDAGRSVAGGSVAVSDAVSDVGGSVAVGDVGRCEGWDSGGGREIGSRQLRSPLSAADIGFSN
jgi:hypothetical protein